MAVNKYSPSQQSYGQTAYGVEMLCSYLSQFHPYLIRLLFMRLPLQQESGA